MKNIIRKLFYWDSPAYGALFGTVLFLPGSWILFSLAALLGGISPDCPGLLKSNAWVWCLSGILFFVFLVYLLICGIHFGKLYRKELSFSKRWKWQIPATCCWILMAVPLLQEFYIFLILNSAFSRNGSLQLSSFFGGKIMVYLSYLGFAAMFAGIFFCAKIIENAAQIPWKKLFGKGVIFILGLFLVTYIATGIMSCSAAVEADSVITRLEKIHGPLNLQTLKDLDTAGRNTDDLFWQKTFELNEKFSGRYGHIYDKFRKDPFGSFSPEELEEWKQKITENPDLPGLEDLFSTPVPAVKRSYLRHSLIETEIPELNVLLNVTRILAWRVRFAGISKDKTAAKAALGRMSNIRNVLCKVPFAISGFFFAECERLRIIALKDYVRQFTPPVDELKTINAEIEKDSQTVPGKTIVTGELIMFLDFFKALSNGRGALPPLKYYGWLITSCRYLAVKNSSRFLQCYENKDIMSVSAALEKSTSPSVLSVSHSYRQLDENFIYLCWEYPIFDTGEEEK